MTACAASAHFVRLWRPYRISRPCPFRAPVWLDGPSCLAYSYVVWPVTVQGDDMDPRRSRSIAAIQMVAILVVTMAAGGLGAWWGGLAGGAIPAGIGVVAEFIYIGMYQHRREREAIWAAYRRLGEPPPPGGWDPAKGVAALLRPEFGIVGFTGRAEILGRLRQWVDDRADGPVFLLTGGAGF